MPDRVPLLLPAPLVAPVLRELLLLAGPAGMTGPAGGLVDLADFHAFMPGDNAATVGVSADVSFPRDGSARAGTNIASNGSTMFTPGAIGIYRVSTE